MKYLATGPWMRVNDNSCRRVVLYRNKPNEYVVHTQSYEDGCVSYTNGDYYASYGAAIGQWQSRNSDFIFYSEPAIVELAEAAELAALANRLVA